MKLPPSCQAETRGPWWPDLLKIPNSDSSSNAVGRPVELFREQPVDAILDGKWLSGVMDRLHLHRDTAGVVTRVEVIDFKTDAPG